MIAVRSYDPFKFNFKLNHVNWPLINMALGVLALWMEDTVSRNGVHSRGVDKGWSSSLVGTNILSSYKISWKKSSTASRKLGGWKFLQLPSDCWLLKKNSVLSNCSYLVK